jgi:ubiquinone/menaquinone biosynthesis C-methylase UbiE
MAERADGVSRVTRSREEARTAYNRLSRWYDALAGASETAFREAGLRMLAASEGENLLEIGFGTGRAILPLARAAGRTGRVVGVDLSDGMASVARARLWKKGLRGRAGLLIGDALRLPCAPASFDAVFACFTLELFDTPEIPAVLGECRRVLRAGGRLCIVALIRELPPNRMTRLYEWAHRRWPAFVDCRPIFLRKALANSGFAVREVVRRSMWGLPVEIVLALSADPASAAAPV